MKHSLILLIEEGDGVTPTPLVSIARTDSTVLPPTLPMEGEGIDLIVHTWLANHVKE